jgi:hypothetical protein
MTIIELNIAGLHVTRFAPSRAAVMRSWQRNFRTLSRNVKNAGCSVAHVRPRPAADRPAA